MPDRRRAVCIGGKLKPPVTPVEIQFVAALEPAKVNVAQAVAVRIAQRHAGAVSQVGALGQGGAGNAVGELQAKRSGRQGREAGPPLPRQC